MSSSPEMPTPTRQRRESMPTPIAAAWPNSSAKMNTNDRIARIAMWPPVMLAASRIVSANGRTNMPMISIGISSGSQPAGQPCGTMFFQCCTKPCARDAGDDDGEEADRRQRRRSRCSCRSPSRRRACTCGKERILGRVQHRVVEQREHVEDRDQADQIRREDEQEERQQQRRLGVHPLACRRWARRSSSRR